MSQLSQGAVREIVSRIGSEIASGRLAQGSILPKESDLAARYGVGRSTLREAVKVLAAKGLLEARPRIGTRVRTKDQWNLLDPDILAWRCATGVDADFLRHLTELREIIEPSAAALAATSRSTEQLESIAQALRSMETASTIAQWVQADLEFHTAVLKATNNPLLMPLAAIIGSALESLLGVTARTSDNFKQALPDHQKVFDAIRLQEPQNALHRMAGMLSDTRSLIRATIQPDT